VSFLVASCFLVALVNRDGLTSALLVSVGSRLSRSFFLRTSLVVVQLSLPRIH
jgi:hypothetical protein